MDNLIFSQIPANELINAISNEVLEKWITLFLPILVTLDKHEREIKVIKDRLVEYEDQLNQIQNAMENLLDEKAAQRKWNDRQRIGFKK